MKTSFSEIYNNIKSFTLQEILAEKDPYHSELN